MVTYVLIIALSWTNPAITAVPGFKTLAECEARIPEVEKQLRETGSIFKLRAFCIQGPSQ